MIERFDDQLYVNLDKILQRIIGEMRNALFVSYASCFLNYYK